eukprot:5742365-Prymnesium_polylepis.2
MLASPPGMVWRRRAAHRLPVAASMGAPLLHEHVGASGLRRSRCAPTTSTAHHGVPMTSSAEAAWLAAPRATSTVALPRGEAAQTVGWEATG